jgi:hypothetical protein
MRMHPALVAARTLINAGRREFALFAAAPRGQDKAAVAIAAFDKVSLAHLKPDPGMAKGAPDPVAGHAPGADDHQLRLWDSGLVFRRHKGVPVFP